MWKKQKFTSAVEDSPKEALAAYLQCMEQEYLWYETASKRHETLWTVAQGIVITASLSTSAIAALAHEETFNNYGWLRILLVVLPLLGTFASSVLLQTRVRDLLALREQGRQSIRTLTDLGRAEFAAASTPERCTTIHRDLACKMDKIDKEQTLGFFAVVPDIKSQ